MNRRAATRPGGPARAGLPALLAVALGASGCGGGEGADAAAERPVDPPKGVSVELHQFRVDQVARRLLVGVRNDGPGPLHIKDLRLVSGSFAPIPPTRFEQSLAPTPRVDLSIPFGAARCGPVSIPALQPAVILARIKGAGGRVRTVRFRLRHPEPLLGQTLIRECGTHILRQSIDVRLGTVWNRVASGSGSTDRDALRGDLLITRTGRGRPVTIATLGSNPHFNLRLAEADLPYAVPPGPGELRLPVEVTPARCDAHAFAEAKYAQRFAVYGEIGDGRQHTLPFESTGAVRATFDAFARSACGVPAPGAG